jgi:ribose 5-phosphate isomerase B
VPPKAAPVSFGALIKGKERGNISHFMPQVFIASDHAGFELKNKLVLYVRELGYTVTDFGPLVYDPEDDYPELIKPCAQKVAQEKDSMGIILGGSGQGEAMVANRIGGVRAAVFYGLMKTAESIDIEGTKGINDGYDIVRLERKHNDANILSLGARLVTEPQAKEAVRIFLETRFSGDPRHERRIAAF